MSSACSDTDLVDQELAVTEIVVAEHTQSLHAHSSADIWPSGTIPVCIQPNVDGAKPGTTAWADYSAWVRSELENAYENIPYAKIEFTGWELCDDWDTFTIPAAPTGKLRVVAATERDVAFFRKCPPGFYFGEGSAGLGACDGGAGYTTSKEPVLYIGANYWCQLGGLLHEMGHALGFRHEYDAPHNVTTQCSTSGSGTTSGEFLTHYDDDSIMNDTYCGYRCAGRLSPGDQLGLSIAYPEDFSRSVFPTHGFLASGGLIVRDDGNLVSEWTHRGALSRVGSVDPGAVRQN